jgi:endonuclease YncB( thermonuclease family)
MFHILHRVYVVAWVSALLGGTAWLYPRTGISEPLADWYDVWRNSQNVPALPVETLTGTVVKVMGPTSFALSGPDQQWYSIGLLGVLPPSKARSTKETSSAVEKSRSELTHLLLSNRVDVTVASMDRQHRGLGIVHLGTTNVNAIMIESGLLQFKREFVKGLPLLEQYQLIRADRRANSAADHP